MKLEQIAAIIGITTVFSFLFEPLLSHLTSSPEAAYPAWALAYTQGAITVFIVRVLGS